MEQQTREQKKLTQEERIERKISLAKERGSRVLRCDTPLGHKAIDMIGQADRAFQRIQLNAGMPGGVSDEEAVEFRKDANEILTRLNELTAKLCKAVKFRYRVPRGMSKPTTAGVDVEMASDEPEEASQPRRGTRAKVAAAGAEA